MAKRSKNKKAPSQQTFPSKRVEAKETLSSKFAPVIWKVLLRAAIIIAAVFWIYWPSLRGGWLWDDDIYVTDNILLRNLAGLWKIWFQPGVIRDYYPLDFTVYWVQWHLWGMAPPGYHVTNVMLHLASSLLVWYLLSKFQLKLAWLGGLLFAIHPVQVESVAWISELKNTLSLPFFLLAMISWINYEKDKRSHDYFLSLALFLLAMLGKPTMAAFPLTLLLYAWWKRDRIDWKDVQVSAPFFLIALILGVVTVWFTQHDQPHVRGAQLAAMEGIAPRMIVTGLVLPFVVWKMFVPLGLMPVYPGWIADFSSPAQLMPWPILAGVVWFLWTKRKSWGRHALLGLGFFLAMLAPVLFFVAANYITMTWSMDHLEYLSMIGLAGLIVAGLEQLNARMRSSVRILGIGALSLVMAWLAWQSHGYARIYAGPETLLNFTLKSNPLAWHANYNLGLIMMKTGRVEQSIDEFQQALKINPYYAKTYDSLGNALALAGRFPEAMEGYEQALSLKPDYAEAYFNLGDLQRKMGRVEEAAQQYQEALKIDPALYKAHYNLGNILLQTGQVPEAMEQYQEALKIAPDYAEAHYNLGNALMKSGRMLEAKDEFEQTLKLKPDYAEAHYGMGNALYVTGRAPEAIDQFEQALKLNPDLGEAHYNLGYALMQTNRIPEAIEQFKQALKLNPNDAGARANLEKLEALKKL